MQKDSMKSSAAVEFNLAEDVGDNFHDIDVSGDGTLGPVI